MTDRVCACGGTFQWDTDAVHRRTAVHRAWKDANAATRFWTHVDRRGPDECWPWRGALNVYGYGAARLRGRRTAHRIAYETAVGPIPDGLTLDHLCRNRACCNPTHLEPVTLVENILRGESPAAVNARKTHCQRGHPFDDLNTYRDSEGRACRTCKREYLRAWRRRRAA